MDGVLLDLGYARHVVSYGFAMLRAQRARHTVADIFENTATRLINRCAVRFETRDTSFLELDWGANRFAEWICGHNIAAGNAAIVMANAPRFLQTWLAFAKCGVSVAFINTSLTCRQMSHCLGLVNPSVVICDAAFLETAAAAVAQQERSGPVVLAVFSAASPQVLTQASLSQFPSPHAVTRPCGCPTLPDHCHPTSCDLLAALSAQAPLPPSRESANAKYRVIRTLANKSLPDPMQAVWGYIYTSGTTGLPKAVAITHQRFLQGGLLLSSIAGLRQDDVLFTALPLFHSAGGVIGGGSCVIRGITLALAPRFRASTFWAEACQSRATAMQYIGEVCRFLVATPLHPDETAHSIRLAVGNGLRPDVWKPFQERFRIAEISEFYASSEGAATTVSRCKLVPSATLFDDRVAIPGSPATAEAAYSARFQAPPAAAARVSKMISNPADVGAVGRFGYLVRRLARFVLLKYNVESDELARDPRTGLCIEVGEGEAGELAAPMLGGAPPPPPGPLSSSATGTPVVGSWSGTGGRRASSSLLGRNYATYLHDEAAMSRRIVRGVFSKGDLFYRSGDLLRRVGQRFYFVDRIGDTFRWRSENVSTTDVAEACAGFPQVESAVVFGVEVHGYDGRAGMGALALKDGLSPGSFDVASFGEHMRSSVAPFAVPVVLRLLLHPPATTATHKLIKTELVATGPSPAKLPAGDALFVWLRPAGPEQGTSVSGRSDPDSAVQSPTACRYVPLTANLWADICSGSVRL